MRIQTSTSVGEENKNKKTTPK